MTWWDLLTPLAAFLGAVAAVAFRPRPPRALRALADGELHLRPDGVHVTPPGESLEHEMSGGCPCNPRVEPLRTVEILVHRSLTREPLRRERP